MQLRPIHQYHLAHNTSNTGTKIPLVFFFLKFTSQFPLNSYYVTIFSLKKNEIQKSHHNCNACMHQRSETIEKGNNSAQSNSILSKKNPTCNVRSQ